MGGESETLFQQHGKPGFGQSETGHLTPGSLKALPVQSVL